MSGSGPVAGARFAPAAERNREPILKVLREALPASGLVLEIASGTGQHAAHFAAGLPYLRWQPSDRSAPHLDSIAAWGAGAALSNLLAPQHLDVLDARWPVERADAIFCANLVHIAPWAVCEGLMAGAARVLPVGAPLVVYGPFMIDGRHTAPSNEAFDADLKARDPSWGLRDLAGVCAAAEVRGLAYERRWEMPANNLTVLFRRVGG